MIRTIVTYAILVTVFFIGCRSSKESATNAPAAIIPGEWITVPTFADTSLANTWLVFSRAATVSKAELKKPITIQVAADTKYWLWVNDRLVIREGGLKWGPTPDSYYVDDVSLDGYLREGENKLDVLVWYFGKDGFAHKDSGKAGLRIDSNLPGLRTGVGWRSGIHSAFGETISGARPNYRLPESNISFDANEAALLTEADQVLYGYRGEWSPALPFTRTETGQLRDIPQWKDFGLQDYVDPPDFPFVSQGDTLVLRLPYNAQITPHLTISAPARRRPTASTATVSKKIDIRTDNYRGGGPPNVRTEYVPRPGKQVFETPGWMNGHAVHYYIPAGITVYELKYRETGFATEFTGSFTCSDPFYNRLWEKARRTLYITMRDNYMDCPDRERAQWWGDVVLEAGETSYALDRTSDQLTRKALRELFAWQRPDSTIFSPIPAGNWNQELPTQMLASAGYYGLWNYYQHTGDRETLVELYPAMKRYLAIWQTDEQGLVIPRKGGWTWGDWGDNKDMPLLFNGWYYLALQGMYNAAVELGKTEDARAAERKMTVLKAAVQKHFWNGKAFRSPEYAGATDDRAQSLMVLTGIAPPWDYEKLAAVFSREQHASPYFEKYVLEALFHVGYATEALERMKMRFTPMVTSPLTTLWEGWEIGSAKYGGGTYNHAWSGGALTLLSQHVLGVQPVSPGYGYVHLAPQLGHLDWAKGTVDTPLGELSVAVSRDGNGELKVDYQAPRGMRVTVIKD